MYHLLALISNLNVSRALFKLTLLWTFLIKSLKFGFILLRDLHDIVVPLNCDLNKLIEAQCVSCSDSLRQFERERIGRQAL